MTGQALRLDPDDPVVVALEDLGAGAQVEHEVVAREAIPRGHKVATRDLARGVVVRKLGVAIGLTRTAIAAGELVHEHNLAPLPRAGQDAEGSDPERSERGAGSSTAAIGSAGMEVKGATGSAGFPGYARPDGRWGTRNHLAIVTTVNCSATVARMTQRRAEETGLLERHSGVDGIVALTHNSGCGLAPGGEALPTLRRTLAGYLRHPNVGGALVVGLGCETNQSRELLADAGLEPGDRLEVLQIQERGGTRATVEASLAALHRLAPRAAADRRVAAPAAGLVVALQCGGSDGFSALTANPALGRAADRVVAAGGSVLLAETPEIVGAEELLLRRAVNDGVREALLERVAWWREHAARNGGALDDNPSPGNLAGGITTLAEKSLGAVAKSGGAPLRGVLRYGETVPGPGLWFMDSPGNDPCSVTGQVAAGANVVCFTTGRGSVSGFKPVPTLKLATTTELYRRMRDDMDLDCGTVLSRGRSHDEVGEEIFRLVLETAGGRPTASERLGFGDEEFVPWQPGAIF